jgi:sugar/nucleoside kinase (ribokinase family)
VFVCTLGDLTLDVIVRLDASFAPGDDSPASTHLGAGGQAANVAAWSAALGAEARLITKRGDDTAAELAWSEVTSRGVDVVGPVVPEHGGVVVSVVGAQDERSMLTDRGPAPGLRAEEIDVAWLRGVDVLHVSGYALLSGPIAEAGAKAAGAARAQGSRLSVDLASAEGISAFGRERLAARLRQLEPDVVFASEPEIEALGAEPEVGTLVVKHGARGLTLVENRIRRHVDAPDADVVDPTGAGDALAAGYLVGGLALGLEAAARCVATMGAMP